MIRLLAQDAEDLAVISAAAQDAVAKLGDIVFDSRARTLTIGLNRYRWERPGERVRSGLQFSSVMAVRSRRLRRGANDAVVELLSIAFEAGEAPGGAITLTFAGGGDLRLEVECIDVVLADVSGPWPSRRMPMHN